MGRIEPALPAHLMKTYSIKAPRATHFRSGTCAEADCPAYLHGWRTQVDESTGLGQGQAYYIRHDSKRRFVEERNEYGLTVFTFEAGQDGFGCEHQIPVGRPELFIVRGGDFRGNPTGESRTHVRPDDWVDDFATHQQAIADQQEKG